MAEVHPADVTALGQGAREAATRARHAAQATQAQDLLLARDKLRRLMPFLEQQVAGEVGEAVKAIDRWLAQWWGNEVVKVEDSVEGGNATTGSWRKLRRRGRAHVERKVRRRAGRTSGRRTTPESHEPEETGGGAGSCGCRWGEHK